MGSGRRLRSAATSCRRRRRRRRWTTTPAGYKIELYTTRTDLHLGDTAMLRSGGLTRSIKLSACIASSADSRRKIKCGTLAATLSDALRQATQGRK